jgi:hypothetical protein
MPLQELIHHARQWRQLSDEEIELQRGYVLNNITLFAEVHRMMFEMVQGGPLANRYSTRYITITQFDSPENGVEGKYR